MRGVLTTEPQSHRGSEDQRDPRTSSIIAAAIEIHRCLGPGLLESAYEECLCHELSLRGLSFRRLLTYLKLTRCNVGLLINFNVPLLKQGLRRLTHQRHSSALPGSQ